MVAARLDQVWATGLKGLPAGGPARGAPALNTPDRQYLQAPRWGQFGLLAALLGMLLLAAGCGGAGYNHDRLGAGAPYGNARPSSMETTRLLSNAHYYKLMGRPDAALKELEEAIRQDPDNLKILDALAQNYQDLGYFQRAQELYQQALARQGGNRALSNNFCFSYYLQGKLDKAESCFLEVLARDPGNTAARNNLGLIWCREGKLAEAKRLWQQAEGAEAAQQRLNQALAFLGESAPSAYAKSTEPAREPALATVPRPPAPAPPAAVAASASKAAEPPAPPVTATPLAARKQAAPPAAVTPPAPKVAATPAPAVTVAPQATQKTAALPVKAKAEPVSQKTAAPLPDSGAAPVAANKSPALTVPVQKQAQSQAPSGPAEKKEASKPLESKPAPAPPAPLSARPAPSAPAAPAPPAAVAASAPKVAEPPAPPVTATPLAARKQAAPPAAVTPPAPKVAEPPAPPMVVRSRTPQKKADKPAKLRRDADVPKEVAEASATPVTLISSTKPMAVTAPSEVKTAPPAASGPPLPVEKQAAAPPTEAKPVAAPPPARPAAVTPPVAKTAAPPNPPVAASPQAEVKEAAGKEAAKTAVAPSLTASEREQAGIEVRNGSRKNNLAQQTRTLLSREGFKVARIGNHATAKSTVIYYRPNEEKVARVLNSEIFPDARLEPSVKIKHPIKIVLGRDLLEQPQLMARLTGKEIAPPSPVIATQPAPQSAAPEKPEAQVAPKASAPSESGAPATQAASGSPAAGSPQSASTNHPTVVLTAADLIGTIIEVRNGAGINRLAHRTRSLLSGEGFNVGIIGNHIDFGAAATVIYYRPWAEKVARALHGEFFPEARLEQSSNLRRRVDIKVLLGHDLRGRPQNLARLAQE